MRVALALWGGVLLALHLNVKALALIFFIVFLAMLFRSRCSRLLEPFIPILFVGALLILVRESGEVIEPSQTSISFEIVARGDSDPLPERVYGSEFQERSCSFRGESRTLDGVSRQIPLRVISRECTVFFGERIEGSGRLRSSGEKRVAATLIVDQIDDRQASFLWRHVDTFRREFRILFQHLGEAGSLVPGMVIGDTALQSDEFDAKMRVAGLSHLTAVSGANFSIVATLVMWLLSLQIRSRRVRILCTVVTLLLFTILVRPTPSVLRAGVMAAVVLYGQLRGNQRSTLLALSGAVTLLLLIDPHQGGDAGFALSVLATLGIVLFSPRISRWIMKHLCAPHVIADVIAIPLAATLLCTPVIVAISGKLSLAAVPLNICVAPLVPLVTILGFATLIFATVFSPLAHFLAWVSHLAAWPIAYIAPWSYSLPIFEVPYGITGAALVITASLLTLYISLSIVRWKGKGRTWGRALIFFALSLALALPIRGPWQAFQCDVGQGDALLMRVERKAAIVIDVGPDPAKIDRCLRLAGIDSIALLVITHLHADHYGGLAGALRGRDLAEWWIAPRSSEARFAEVETLELKAGKPATVVSAGMRFAVADVSIEVLWPDREDIAAPKLNGDGSEENNRSITLLIEKDGARILAGGDIEPSAQAEIARRYDISDIDIYKVSHHGSAFRSEAFDNELNPSLALVSVGAKNPYGHPAPEALAALAPAKIHRTDRDGSARITWFPLKVR